MHWAYVPMLIVYHVPMVKTMPEETKRIVLVENKEDDTLEFKYLTEKEYTWLLLQEKNNQPKNLT